MGRLPIGKNAMTAAERQRKRRRKLARGLRGITGITVTHPSLPFCLGARSGIRQQAQQATPRFRQPVLVRTIVLRLKEYFLGAIASLVT